MFRRVTNKIECVVNGGKGKYIFDDDNMVAPIKTGLWRKKYILGKFMNFLWKKLIAKTPDGDLFIKE